MNQSKWLRSGRDPGIDISGNGQDFVLSGVRRSPARESVIPIALALVAIAVRVPRLSRSLWLDEGYSLAASQHLPKFDSQRPLYFWFLRAWSAVSMSEAWLRLPSVACGVGCVLFVCYLARRHCSERVAFTAALLMALSSAQIEHSIEVRMYTFAPFFLLASVAFLLQWFDRRAMASLALCGLFAYLALLTFPAVALGLVGIFGFALWRLRGESRAMLSLLALGALIGIAWAPFVWIGAHHQEGTAWLSRPNALAPVSLHGWALLSTSLFLGDVPGASAITRAASVLVLGLACLGAWAHPLGRKLGSWFYGIVLALFALSFLARPMWLGRYFMPFAPALFVLVALGIGKLRERSRALHGAAFGALVAVELVGILGIWHAAPSEDWRSAAAFLQERVSPGDTVVVAGAQALTDDAPGVWAHYWGGPSRYLEDGLDEIEPGYLGWVVVRVDAPEIGLERVERFSRKRDAEQVRFPGVDVFKLGSTTR